MILGVGDVAYVIGPLAIALVGLVPVWWQVRRVHQEVKSPNGKTTGDTAYDMSVKQEQMAGIQAEMQGTLTVTALRLDEFARDLADLTVNFMAHQSADDMHFGLVGEKIDRVIVNQDEIKVRGEEMTVQVAAELAAFRQAEEARRRTQVQPRARRRITDPADFDATKDLPH